VIWLRTTTAAPPPRSDERYAHIVVDLRDPAWPVIRHIDSDLADRHTWHLAETRAFFAVRADTWDAKFGADLPAYTEAVAESRIPSGGIVIDVGCGTGRALLALQSAVGPTGTVIGLDITEQMLRTARDHGRAQHPHLVLADARRLPLPDASVDAVFAAGLIGHLPDVEPGLAELARVTVHDGLLTLFHPSGRAALAARHGRSLGEDEPLAKDSLQAAMLRTGWKLTSYDDPPHRFFALAIRQRARAGAHVGPR
jgi:SAM-dependent methyltransferase